MAITKQQKIERLKREIAKLETQEKLDKKKLKAENQKKNDVEALTLGREVFKYLEAEENKKVVVVGLLEFFVNHLKKEDESAIYRWGTLELNKRKEQRQGRSRG